MDRLLVAVNQFSCNGTLLSSAENMIIGDSNPMQNLRKNMQKKKIKEEVPFLKDCFNETSCKIRIFWKDIKMHPELYFHMT